MNATGPHPARRPARSNWTRALPLFDAAERFSMLRTTVFALLCLPALLVAARYAGDALGARPLNEALHQIGNWALWLLLASLAVRPARTLLDLPRLTPLRRMVGVAAFCYAAAHVALYVVAGSFDVARVASEIALRLYLTIGCAALIVLAALAATSTDGMARRLGGRRWRNLHRMVYAVAVLAILHFFMQVKANADEPWIAAGIFAWLMACRWLPRPARGATWQPLAAAFGAATATAAAESLHYAIRFGADPLALFAANVTFEAGTRPAIPVLVVCTGGALAGLARRRPAPRARASTAA